MKKLVTVLVAAIVISACLLSGVTTAVAPSAPTGTAPSDAPTETSVPPSLTTQPPTATPPPVISAETVGGLSPFMSFAEGELVRSLAFSPDGTVLAAAVGDEAGTIRLYEVASGLPLRTLEGHESIVWGIAFSPDGRFLASASRDHTAKVWDWRSGTLLQSLDFPNEVVAVGFSPNSRTLAVGGVDELPGAPLQDAAIWTFAVDMWERGIQFAEFWNIPDIAYSPDGSLIVGGGTSRNVRVWRTSDGAEQFILYHAGQVSSIAISPDGSTAATGLCQQSTNAQCTIGAIWLWDLSTGRLIEMLSDFPEVVVGVGFSPDGSLVIGGSRDGTLRAYATSEYEPLLIAASPRGTSPVGLISLAISPDGRIIATGGVGNIHLWRVEP